MVRSYSVFTAYGADDMILIYIYAHAILVLENLSNFMQRGVQIFTFIQVIYVNQERRYFIRILPLLGEIAIFFFNFYIAHTYFYFIFLQTASRFGLFKTLIVHSLNSL